VSFQYDQYLARHRANVKRGFDWLSENLPGLMTNTLTAGWNTEFAHDQSKNEPDEIIFCDEQSDYLARLNEIHGGTKKGEKK
jgi:hypothetical protein